MVNFKQNLYSEELNLKETRELKTGLSRGGDIPTSAEVSGIEVRLSKAHILDNKTKPFGPFPGLAKIYFLNIIVSDLSDAKIDLNLNGFEKVDDNQTLAVDRTLFLWKQTDENAKPPSQIHVMSSLIKSKQALRNTAEIISKAKDDNNFKDLTTQLGTLLKAASSVSNISDLAFEVAGIVGGLLGNVEDKPLLTRFQSFTDIAGDFNSLGKHDSPFSNKYAELDYSIFVRDKARQQEADE